MKIIDTFKLPVAEFVLKENIKILTKFSKKWASDHPTVHLSNKGGGYQSPPLTLDIPQLQSLRREAKRCFNEFRKVFYYDCMFEVANMWLNINSPNSYNSQHDHPFTCLSGCFYIATPEKSGDIIFHNNYLIQCYMKAEHMTEYGWYNSTEWTLPAKENYFYVFPAWLHHSVERNNSSKDRISISINATEKK